MINYIIHDNFSAPDTNYMYISFLNVDTANLLIAYSAMFFYFINKNVGPHSSIFLSYAKNQTLLKIIGWGFNGQFTMMFCIPNV